MNTTLLISPDKEQMCAFTAVYLSCRLLQRAHIEKSNMLMFTELLKCPECVFSVFSIFKMDFEVQDL